MSKLFNFFNNTINEDLHFIEMVKANENEEEWAQEELQKLWNSNDKTLIPRVFRAYVTIYEDAAYQGDRNAIIKYARGLEWSDREDEALDWYMKLIDNGDTDAMLELALDYSELGGMGNNEKEHDKWVFAAAKAGNAKALNKAGTILTIKGDFSAAKAYFKASAEKGCPEGKANYADRLRMDMTQISEYEQNQNTQKPDCLEEYISWTDDLIQILIRLYYKIENLYIDALSESEEEETLLSVFSSLSTLYLYPPKGTFAPSPYRSAYFAYMKYTEFDIDSAFERFKEIDSDYHLDISREDLEEWESASFEDWIEKKGITEGVPLFELEGIIDNIEVFEEKTEINSDGKIAIRDEIFESKDFENNDIQKNNAHSLISGIEKDNEEMEHCIFEKEFKTLLCSTDIDELLKKADAFFLGKGENVDDNKAFVLYQRCNEIDPTNTYIMARLGQCYNAGLGTKKDSEKAMTYLIPAAEANETDAMYLLGYKYADGDGVEQNTDKALYYLTPTAETGDDDFQAAIGDIYYFGKGIAKDYELAKKWYIEAAKNNNSKALDNLGYMFLNGDGVEKSYEEANKYWVKSAELGSCIALLNLGLNYINGFGVEKNKLKAKELFEKAASQGYPPAFYELGLLYEEGSTEIPQDIDKAIFWYEKGTEAKNEDSILHLALIHSKSNFNRINYEKAVELYEILLEQYNSFKAANELGFMYEHGYGVEKDYKKAFDYYQHGANLQSVRSITCIADLYYSGNGVERDPEKAFKLFKFAKEHGDDIARGYLMAISTDLTEEPHPDSWLAVQYLQPLAESGDAFAQYQMYKACISGAGTKKDDKLAAEWLKKAAEQDYPGALFEKGLEAYSNRNIQKCISYWEKASPSNEKACFELGKLYLTGDGVNSDFSKGLQLITSSAESGFAPAQRYLGIIYGNGEYVEKDLVKEKKWLEKAASLNDEYAILILAVNYQEEGALDKVEELYRKVIEMDGSMKDAAFYGLATYELYRHDYKRYYSYLLDSAQLGYTDAQFEVGLCYYEAKGTSKDTKEAIKWLKKAAENGSDKAKKYLEIINTKEKHRHNKLSFIIIFVVLIIGTLIASQIKFVFETSPSTTLRESERTTVASSASIENTESDYTVQSGQTTKNRTAVVTAEPSLRLRVAPNTECEVLANIPTNGKIEVIETENNVSGWVYVYYNTRDLYGWVSTQYIKYTEELSSQAQMQDNTGDIEFLYVQTVISILDRLSESEEYSFDKCFFELFRVSGDDTPFALANYEGNVILLHYQDGEVKILYMDYMPYSITIFGNGKDLIVSYAGGAPTIYSLDRYIFNGIEFKYDSTIFSGSLEPESGEDGEALFSMSVNDEDIEEHVSNEEFFNVMAESLTGYKKMLTETINTYQ